ncbi:LTA synthase family protein [Chromohalobacter sp. HP20-39]|uniref:LTA synthase family protein n=1 Tax=Chromohalobacter sp. HP20-39 TaxID=3079306 RepID=UPI00294B361C|nr:sulfatase-like hydrolase/transferase [Chromohalobacter sp. HP20-39]MDV6317509.1 sulfatase-like hydrolase/transferase [Chromohalobacter sp. HP20-39]
MYNDSVTVSRWQHWRELNRQLWRLGLIGVATLTLMRVLLWQLNAPPTLEVPVGEMWQAFWMGLRFDAKIMAVLLGPWLIVATALLPLPRVFMAGWRRLWLVWAIAIMALVNLLALINHFFFTFYQGPINSLIFGLFEDDTQAVLQTIWSDYPFIPLLIVLIGMTGTQVALMRRGRRHERRQLGWRRATLLVVASWVALIGLGRGTLGTFPLREMHMAVSSNSFINDLVPSGPEALYLAWKERQVNRIGDDPQSGLARYGFNSPMAAAEVLGWSQADTPQAVLGHMTETTPVRPAAKAKPPHVVFSLMESWGRHPLDFDDPENNDLLGRLRPWVKEKADYFPHALSAENGTHPSLEGLLLDTPISPLTQSRYGYRQYSTSTVLPYERAGYHTVFLTAGSTQWRDLDDALKRQGFDEVLGESAIRERFPEAKGSTWGLYDEWMFRYAEELLKQAEANDEKLLLVMLSITNHPPYKIPEDYDPGPLDVSRLGDELAVSPEFGTSILETYQYANDSMGRFLNHLEADGLMDHTLFAATGDHNTRSLIQYPDAHDLFDQFGVPILMWIPPAYRNGGEAQVDDWTSHRDIFPTLWAHSLSNAQVPWMGRDLYTPEPSPMALTFNQQDGGQGVMISDAGAATSLANPTYYRWSDDALQAVESPSRALKEQTQRARARMALEDWRIRREALQVDTPETD